MTLFFTYLIRGYTLAFKVTSYLLLISLAAMLLYSGSAHAVGLKNNSVVTSDTIKLGDLFYDLSRDENKVLGQAPRPGKDMVINARTLLRIAMAMGLDWRPTSAADRVVLSRDGTVIDKDAITGFVKEALTAKGLNGKYNIAFGTFVDDITLPADMPANVDITELEIKPSKNWFEAVLMAPSKENPIQRMRINGTIENVVEIPVMRDTIGKGTIIGLRDIGSIEMPERLVKHNTVLDPQVLIGMTPRRLLATNQPIQTGDIEAPVIVKRGEIVTMHYASGPLQLSAKGKALENGAKGDLIRIVNTSSSKTIEAEVTNTKEVKVQTF